VKTTVAIMMSLGLTGMALTSMTGARPARAQSEETVATTSQATASLAPQLEPLRPFIGRTWRSVPPAGAEKRVVDVSKWERALNGQAVRVLHSINDGIYGGETIIFWDAEKKSLVYYYFTTGGHYTQGTLAYENGALIGDEMVTGDSDGVTEVRSTTMILPDGRMHSKAEYLQKGAWTPGHEFFYVEDPTAQVIFK
jgi:hypothetical protein